MKVLSSLVLISLSMVVLFSGCRKETASTEPAKPVIKFWTTESYHPEERDHLRAMAEKFEQETGTHVEISFMHWDDVVSKYNAALSAGDPPNIGQHGPDLAMNLGQQGSVVPVDDIIEDLGKDRFFPEFLDEACLYDGHYWSVPWFIEVRSLLIRKDWLEELKLQPPVTWEDWLTVCKAMTRDLNGNGEPDTYGYALYGRDQYAHTWTGLCAANGGGLFDEEGNPSFTDPKNLEALEWYCNLYLKHHVTPLGTRSASWMIANDYYVQGLVGSIVTNGYILQDMKVRAPELLENSMFVPIPVPEKGGKSISYLGGSQLMLFKDAPHMDKAKDFLRFLLTGDAYLDLLKSTDSGALPVFKDVASDPYFTDDPFRSVLVQQIQGAVRHGYRGGPQPVIGAIEGEQIFGMPLRLLISGDASAKEALQKAQDAAEKLIEQRKAISR